jgi:hypothetical protein
MKTKILILVGILSVAALAGAVISSYGSVTGYATVGQGISIDIYGSSNDESYNLKAVHQGEIVYSPKIKLKNSVGEPVNFSVIFEILPESAGDEEDLSFSIVNEHKNETLGNPITIPTDDLYFYVEHKFQPYAELGNYTFSVDILPA